MSTGTTSLLVLLAIIFVLTGAPKIVGVKHFSDAFEKFGYPQWLRFIAGVNEFVGALFLIAGIWYPAIAAPGGLLILPIICGASYTNYVKVNAINGTITAVIAALVALSIYLTLPYSLQALGIAPIW